jgi:hypothetical protein
MASTLRIGRGNGNGKAAASANGKGKAKRNVTADESSDDDIAAGDDEFQKELAIVSENQLAAGISDATPKKMINNKLALEEKLAGFRTDPSW